MKNLNILLIDGLSRSGLAVARGIKAQSRHRLHAVVSHAGRMNGLRNRLRSAPFDKIHFSSSGFWEPSFIDELENILAGTIIDAVIPISQAAAVAVSKSKPRLEKYSRILIEDFDKVMEINKKIRTITIARKTGIAHPKTLVPDNLDEVRSYAEKTTCPVVIKARRGSGGHGLRYAWTSREIVPVYQAVSDLSRHDDGLINDRKNPLIQEYIPGEIHDALIYAVDGSVLTGLTQKRIATRPESGGFGIVNITTRNPLLMEYAGRIAKHTGWNGVFMAEFKIRRPGDEPVLLEVNPRFWGTTWLSIKAGVNFPHYLVSDAFGTPVDYPQDYREGLVCRWIMDEIGGIKTYQP